MLNTAECDGGDNLGTAEGGVQTRGMTVASRDAHSMEVAVGRDAHNTRNTAVTAAGEDSTLPVAGVGVPHIRSLHLPLR